MGLPKRKKIVSMMIFLKQHDSWGAVPRSVRGLSTCNHAARLVFRMILEELWLLAQQVLRTVERCAHGEADKARASLSTWPGCSNICCGRCPCSSVRVWRQCAPLDSQLTGLQQGSR